MLSDFFINFLDPIDIKTFSSTMSIGASVSLEEVSD
jgi:hypothetical protein